VAGPSPPHGGHKLYYKQDLPGIHARAAGSENNNRFGQHEWQRDIVSFVIIFRPGCFDT
jgi:hypothetical protein